MFLCDRYALCGKLIDPMPSTNPIIEDLQTTFGDAILAVQPTRDEIPTLWVSQDRVNDVLHLLKTGVDRPYTMLYDLTAIDERTRKHRQDQPESEFTVVYHLLSFDRNEDIRIKVRSWNDPPPFRRSPISGNRPTGTSVRYGTSSGYSSTATLT